MQALVDCDAQPEFDALRDVQPMKFVVENACPGPGYSGYSRRKPSVRKEKRFAHYGTNVHTKENIREQRTVVCRA